MSDHKTPPPDKTVRSLRIAATVILQRLERGGYSDTETPKRERQVELNFAAASIILQQESELKILRRLAKKAEWGGTCAEGADTEGPECPVCLADGDTPNPLHYSDCLYTKLAELRRATPTKAQPLGSFPSAP